MSAPFAIGASYTRSEIAELVGLPPARRKGGNWATGYSDWDDQTFVFANVGVAGRTGHDYANRWDGKNLIWFGKTNSNLQQPQIARIVDPEHITHVFWRGSNGAPFTYAGVGTAQESFPVTPVRVIWSFNQSKLANGDSHRSAIWRRGPKPAVSIIPAERIDLASLVYVMKLLGANDCRPIGVPSSHAIIKIGITNNPARRLAELNSGFPPGSPTAWVFERVLECASPEDAWLIEGARLEALRRAGYWIGGEFAALPENLVRDVVPGHWKEGRGSIPDLDLSLPVTRTSY